MFVRALLPCLVAMLFPMDSWAQVSPAAAPTAPAPAAAAAPGQPGEAAAPAAPAVPPPPAKAKLIVESTPTNALRKVSGRPVLGQQMMELAAGSYTIEVSAPGHHPFSKTVALRPGQMMLTHIKLDRIPPPPPAPPNPVIILDTDLTKATVIIDGKTVPAEKGKPIQVGPGKHEVKLLRNGLKPWKQEIEVEPGQSVNFGALSSTPADDGMGPWVTIGLGVGLGALGAVFATERPADEQRLSSGGPNVDDDRATASLVLYTVGGALVATGVTLMLMDGGDDEARATISPSFGDGSAAVTGTLSF